MKTNKDYVHSKSIVVNGNTWDIYYRYSEKSNRRYYWYQIVDYDHSIKVSGIYNTLEDLINKHPQFLQSVEDSIIKNYSNKDYKPRQLIVWDTSSQPHTIQIFDKQYYFRWNFNLDRKTTYDINHEKLLLTINCNVDCMTNNKKRKNIFIDVMKEILYQYVFEQQAYYAKLMQYSYSNNIDISIVKTWYGKNFSSGTIKYNLLMLCHSKECIDSVIVHELAHNRYKNHSKEFHLFGKQFAPNARECVKYMNKYDFKIE